MNTGRNIIYTLLAIALILIALSGLFWLLRATANWITAQDSEIAAATIAFLGTITAGIGAVVISNQRTKAREIAEAHRPIKTELYMSFATEMIGILRQSKGGSNLDPEAMRRLEDFFFDFTTKVMMWGSPAVLSAYGKFRKAGGSPDIVLLVDDVLQAMRKDLGLSNWNLQRGDLFKLFLTDPESIDTLLKKRRPGN